MLVATRRFAPAPELVLKLLLLGSRLIGNHRSPIIAFATPLDHSITAHLLDLVGFASFPALLFRHPACRTISLHLTGPGHPAPHAITNACCGVAVETNNKWKSGFRHHADASRYPTEDAFQRTDFSVLISATGFRRLAPATLLKRQTQTLLQQLLER